MNINLFPHSSGGWKTEIRVPEGLSSGEFSLPGLYTAAFSLFTHMTFLCMSVHGEKEKSLFLFF